MRINQMAINKVFTWNLNLLLIKDESFGSTTSQDRFLFYNYGLLFAIYFFQSSNRLKIILKLGQSGALASKVTISNKEFRFGGSRLFISGANQAWHWYGYDFGDGQYYKDPSRVYQRNIDQGKFLIIPVVKFIWTI